MDKRLPTVFQLTTPPFNPDPQCDRRAADRGSTRSSTKAGRLKSWQGLKGRLSIMTAAAVQDLNRLGYHQRGVSDRSARASTYKWTWILTAIWA